MKVNAIYHHEVMEDGREVHSIDHDNGGFVVSSKEVGVAVQNFLHYAMLQDIATLHSHLLREYARRFALGDSTGNDERAIRERGEKDGKSAASWIVDGNTDDPCAVLTRIVQGMEDGDPEILDSLPNPRLGGEFADDPTWEQICMDEIERYNDDGEEHLLAIYHEAFHEGVVAQIEAMAGQYCE